MKAKCTLLVLIFVMTACSDSKQTELPCEPYRQGEALITNGDTGERKIDGDITAQVQVSDGDKTYIALNVAGTIVAVVRDGLTASLDAESEAATSFPMNGDMGSIDDVAAQRAVECASCRSHPRSSVRAP